MSAITWEIWISAILLTGGCFFSVTGSLGVLRMPDFYSRLHPAGKSDTLAQALILLGLLVLALPSIMHDYILVIKLMLLIMLLLVTAPTATHAISKAACLDSRMPRHWERDEDAHVLPEIHHTTVGASDSLQELDDSAAPPSTKEQWSDEIKQDQTRRSPQS